jgi:ribosomal protein L21E
MTENEKLLPLQLNQINMLMLQFNVYKEFDNGGKIEIMEGYIKKTDHKDLLAISKYFAEKGDKVQITTNVHFKDEKYKEVFGGLIGTKYERKCPDLIINGKYYEYESFMRPFKKVKIKRMLNNGLMQSSRIIINNTKGCSDRYIKKLIHDRLKLNQQIEEVWVYEKGVVKLLYKKQ